MEFPKTLLVADLEIKNACYDAKKIIISEALYYGGSKFESIKNQVLPKRTFEEQGAAGKKMRESRLRSAYYGAPVAGFIDFLAACVFQSDPKILFDGPEDRVAYYNQINESLPSVIHSRLIQLILHGQGIMSLTESQNEDGSLKPSVCGIDYACIVDWDRESDGDLEWIKTKSVDLVRLNPWEQPTIERHTWSYFCEDGFYEYVAEKPIGDPWKMKATASLDNSDEDTNALSAFTEIVLPTGFCLLDSVASLVIGLFAREASIDFALDNSAFAFLCIFTKKALNKVIVSEFQGLKLNPEDKAEWISPAATNFAALQDRAEQMRKQLENRIQSAALNLASRDVSGRASGIAKFRDFGPIAILLQFYGEVLRAAIEEHIEKLIALKGDTGIVTFKVLGLDEFDIQSLDSKMSLVTQFLALPAGQTAKKWALGSLEKSMLADAPVEILEQAEEEAEERDEIPDPAAPPAPAEGANPADEEDDSEDNAGTDAEMKKEN